MGITEVTNMTGTDLTNGFWEVRVELILVKLPACLRFLSQV
jgi:hypothetical protein